MAADPTKVQAIQQWQTPKTVASLPGLLGLTGYYRHFVKNYATIATPLTDLLKKNCFTWTTEVQSAFDTLKAAMISLPVLGLPDFSATFDVTHPLAFFSKKLCPRMQLASTYDREMFTITEAVKKCR